MFPALFHCPRFEKFLCFLLAVLVLVDAVRGQSIGVKVAHGRVQVQVVHVPSTPLANLVTALCVDLHQVRVLFALVVLALEALQPGG